MDAKSWTVDDSQAATAGAFEEHLGRSSIHLQRGIAMLNGVSIQNGSVEADVIPSHPGSGFIGLAFRVQSTKKYELIYIRNGIGKQPNAVQYDPVFRGSITWQMHPGLQADAEIPQDRWNHLKIVFNGPRAEFYIDHADKPLLVVNNLEQGDSRGSIGVWSLADGGYVSNVEYTQTPEVPYVTQPQAFAADALTDWSLSPGFRAQEVKPTDYPQLKQLTWEKVATDPPGILMIDRYRDSPDIFVPDRRLMEGDGLPLAAVVFAKTVIHSDADIRRQLVFGYSDEIVMYLNGQPIFTGKNGLGYRETGAFGRLGMSESVYLPLKKGDNELVFAMKEYSGGWGLPNGIEVVSIFIFDVSQTFRYENRTAVSLPFRWVSGEGGDFGITDERGVLDDRTYPFTSVGFICGQVGTSKSSDMLAFYCFSTDFRYTFNFIGRKEYIPEASEIAKQVIR